MLLRSKQSSAPSSERSSASRARPRRYSWRRRKSTRCSKSTAIAPGAGAALMPVRLIDCAPYDPLLSQVGGIAIALPQPGTPSPAGHTTSDSVIPPAHGAAALIPILWETIVRQLARVVKRGKGVERGGRGAARRSGRPQRPGGRRSADPRLDGPDWRGRAPDHELRGQRHAGSRRAGLVEQGERELG